MDLEEVAGDWYTARETLDGTDAIELRQRIDAAGDKNGMVSTEEVEAWRFPEARKIQPHDNCRRDFSMIAFDGARPRNEPMSDLRFTGAEGPVDSTSPIKRKASLMFFVNADDYEDVRVRLNLADKADVVSYFQCEYGRDDVPFLLRLRPNEIRVSQGLDDQSDVSCDVSPKRLSDQIVMTHRDNANNPLHTLIADTPEEVGIFYAQEVMFRERKEFPDLGIEPDGFQICPAIFGLQIGGGGGAAALLLVVSLHATLRFKLASWIAAGPLFSRLERNQAMIHERRERLYMFIKENPGATFTDLRRELQTGPGTLLHHLGILRSQGFLSVKRDGFRTRFHLQGDAKLVEPYLSVVQQKLVDAVRAAPGITQRELQGALGLPRPTIIYHVDRLESAGQLLTRPDGRRRRHFIKDSSAGAV